jgi:hypothetical protein
MVVAEAGVANPDNKIVPTARAANIDFFMGPFEPGDKVTELIRMYVARSIVVNGYAYLGLRSGSTGVRC